MKTAKATPNREVSEDKARVVGLLAPLLEPEVVPVLEGPVVPVLVPLVWTVELWAVEEGDGTELVGREAYRTDEVYWTQLEEAGTLGW